jgi:drug/metabolite transporter (DMT)-like permease
MKEVSIMQPMRLFLLTVLAMLAFAANSLLCRIALKSGSIDPATFTALRLGYGALMLALVVRLRGASPWRDGSWRAALMLFGYAAAFSFAYVSLPAGVGALLLFGAVQATMIAAGLWRGERLSRWQWAGMVLAMGGLVLLLLPGLTAPPIGSALLMLVAGVGWGAYSLCGRTVSDAGAATAGNFLRAAPLAIVLVAAFAAHLGLSAQGLGYALISGAITSGLGYIVWYAVLPRLPSSIAATVQLSVPLLAGLGGVALLGEAWTARLGWSGAALLGGIALVVLARRRGA